ncbi:MAG: ABC-F family ATP-binding cassette domain-containing protein [Planctomycetes bacterium]|nr:ABC-F family ATP-binding cassette domain-containing protein [Planctomycetota bacterium]
MIQISNLTKSYGKQELYSNVTLSISSREKVGFVGRNGSGKSTLFRLILGEEQPDSGIISKPKGYKIGTLEQHLKFTRKTVLEEVATALSEDEIYDHWKVEKILFGLGFSGPDMEKPPESFSGGYQIRMNLAKLLVQNPHMLLLDEPTNYLDIVSLRWLKGWLRSFQGEAIIITHDRGFMDEVTTHTMGIVRRQLRKLKGDTVTFFETLAHEDEIHEKARIHQEKRIKEIEEFVARNMARASTAGRAQSRLKLLDKIERIEKLDHDAMLAFRFNHVKCPGKVVMEAHNLSFSYDGNLNNALFKDLTFTVETQDRIAIIGKNGKGKSTLLNLLAGELKPLTGSMITHPSIKTGHFGQTNIQRLDLECNVLDELIMSNPSLNNQRLRSLAGAMMFSGDAAEKKIKVLSGGERSRVLLGKILANPTNFLLLDEPTNHLDMESIEELTEQLDEYEGAVIIVTHSEMILRDIATKLIIFNGENAQLFLGKYDDFLEKIGWDDEPKAKKKEEQEKRVDMPDVIPARQKSKKKRERDVA